MGGSLLLSACAPEPPPSTDAAPTPARSPAIALTATPAATPHPTEGMGIKAATIEPIIETNTKTIELETASSETLWATLFASYLAFLQKPTSYLQNSNEVDVVKWQKQEVDFAGKKQTVASIINEIEKDKSKAPTPTVLPLKPISEEPSCEEVFAALWWHMAHHMVGLAKEGVGLIAIPEGYDSSMHGWINFPRVYPNGEKSDTGYALSANDAIRFLQENCQHRVSFEWQPEKILIRHLEPALIPTGDPRNVWDIVEKVAEKSAVPVFVIVVVGGAILIAQPESAPVLLLAVAIP